MAVGDEQQRAFDKLKDSLLSELCMQPGCAKSNDTAKNQVIIAYNRQLIYRTGKDAENPVNFMSCYPRTTESEERKIAEDSVNYVCNQAVPKATTLQEIRL